MRSFRIPIFILLLTLLLCLFAGSSVARYTNAWTRQLQSADDLVCREQWSNAEAALSGSLRPLDGAAGGGCI